MSDFHSKVTDTEPSKCKPHNTVKHTQTICRLLLTNCLSVFDHFVGLVPKGVNKQVLKGYFSAFLDQ